MPDVQNDNAGSRATLGDRVDAALKAAGEQAMRNSNMGQIQSYRINHIISLIEREVAAEQERCAEIAQRIGDDCNDFAQACSYVKEAIKNGRRAYFRECSNAE